MQNTKDNIRYIIMSFVMASLGLAGYIYCSRFSIKYPEFRSYAIGFTVADFILLCMLTRLSFQYIKESLKYRFGSMLFALIFTALTFYMREIHTPNIINRLLTEVPVVFILFSAGLVLVYYVFIESLRNKYISFSISKTSIISILISILFVLAYKYTHTDDLKSISEFISRISVFEIMLVCLLQRFISKSISTKLKINKMYIVFSIILAISNILLNDIYKHNELLYTLRNYKIFYALIVLVYSFVFYTCISYLSHYLHENINANWQKEINIFSLASLILLLWSPIYLLFYPGALTNEATLNINFALGLSSPVGFSPVYFQLFLGIFVSIGRLIGSDTMGVVIYFIVVGYISALAMAMIIKRASMLNLSHSLMQFMYIFCIANPFIILKTFTMQYDTLLGIALLYFSILLYDITLQGKDFVNKKNLVLLFISGFMICAFRNVGKALLAISILIFSIYGIRKVGKKALLASLSLILALSTFILSNSLLFKQMKYSKNANLANWAIPLQQISLVIQNRGIDALNDTEKEQLTSIIDPMVFVNNPNPDIIDPIKHRIESATDSKTFLGKKMDTLRSLWWSLAKHYPLDYVKAFIRSTCLYFAPGHFDNWRQFNFYQHQTYSSKNWESRPEFKLSSSSPERYKHLTQNSAFTGFTTVFGLYMSAGAIQLLGLFIFFLARQKKMATLCLLPSVIYALGTVFAPVNGDTRYMTPSGFVIPLFILYALYIIKNSNIKNEQLKTE